MRQRQGIFKQIRQFFSLSRSNIGMGTRSDKTTMTTLSIPWETRTEYGLAKWHQNSWVCRDVVNKPAEELCIKWRVFDSDDDNEEVATALMDAEKKHKVLLKVFEAVWKARLYGSSLICVISKEANMMTPLDIRKIKPGDLQNLHVVSRFRATPEEEIMEVDNPDYGEPEYYSIWEGWSDYSIHSTRTIRLDAHPSDGNSYGYSFTLGDYRWSDSVLHAMLDEVERDLIMAQGAGHMVQEASLKVLQVADLNERRSGRTSGNDGPMETIDQVLQQISRDISIYNTLVVDKDDTMFERVEAKIFAGVDKLLTMQQQRVSGATGIPSTILWGRSPAGMNATGDSDMTIYQRLIDVLQTFMADPALGFLDPLLAADAGVNYQDIPDYHWPKLTEKNALQEAQAFKTRVEGMVLLQTNHVINEDENRRAISGDPAIGELEGDAPEVEADEDDMTRMQEEIEKLRAAPMAD